MTRTYEEALAEIFENRVIKSIKNIQVFNSIADDLGMDKIDVSTETKFKKAVTKELRKTFNFYNHGIMKDEVDAIVEHGIRKWRETDA